MRLGGPIFAKTDTPESWAEAVAAAGYRAAYCPVAPDADSNTLQAYATAAHKADIVIAEVGAWSNPLSPDAATAKAALEKCKASLALADRIGTRCCVTSPIAAQMFALSGYDVLVAEGVDEEVKDERANKSLGGDFGFRA